MKSYDFEYDGATLSNYGFTVCSFDSGDLETVQNGSEITFNTVPVFGGAKYQLTSTSYDSCLETTFQICKLQCVDEDLTAAYVDEALVDYSAVGITNLGDNGELSISLEELRSLMKWLNRKGFYKFKLLDDEYTDYYFEGSFNISRIEMDDILVGLELTFVTNRPFALLEPVTIKLSGSSNSWTGSFDDLSDDEGYIYPYTQITINSAGNLEIYNNIEERTTYIANCTKGEVITMNYPIISSSNLNHKIQDDFNWNFLRIANTVWESKNALSVSLPCEITMIYSPIVKVGL